MVNSNGTGRRGDEQTPIEDAEWEEIDEPARAETVIGRKSSSTTQRPQAAQPPRQRGGAVAKKAIKNVVLGWLIFTFSIGGLQATCTSARRISSIFVSQIGTSRCPDITGISLIDHGPLALLLSEMQWGQHSG